MIHFVAETLAVLPFLFVTYLVLETVEAKAGGALEGFFGRARRLGPVAGAIAGLLPQCGFSAAAASFFSGGVVTAGTIIAVFLSTSDELVPVLISKQVPSQLLLKILCIKCAGALFAGLFVDAVLKLLRRDTRRASMQDVCRRSHCGCSHRHGIFVPALIHTLEIFACIAVVSGAVELCMHFGGETFFEKLRLTTPVAGECIAGLMGLVPNCAVSVAAAELYCKGAISAGALMASSFTGAGVGLIVLFRANRNIGENLFILAVLLFSGILFGILTGPLIAL